MLGEAAPPYPWESRQQRPQCGGGDPFPTLCKSCRLSSWLKNLWLAQQRRRLFVLVVLASATGIITCHTFSIGKCVGEISLLPHKQRAPSCISCPYMNGVCCAIWTAGRNAGGKGKRGNPGSVCQWEQEGIFLTP